MLINDDVSEIQKIIYGRETMIADNPTTGVYKTPYFGSSAYMRDYDPYPKLKDKSGYWFGSYEKLLDLVKLVIQECADLGNSKSGSVDCDDIMAHFEKEFE